MSDYFEAVQLAGFGEAEAMALFRRPPKGVALNLEPMAAVQAQERFVSKFEQLQKRL